MAVVPARTDDLGRVRRFTRWSLIWLAVVTLGLPLIDVASRDLAPAAVVALILGLLLVGGVQLQLLLGAMGPVAPRALLRPQVLAAGVVSLALLALAVPDSSPSGPTWWVMPFAGMVGAVVLWLPGQRRWWLVGAGTVLAAVTATVATGLSDGDVLAAVIPAVVVVPFIAATDVLQVWLWNVTVRLDEARETAGELAVLRERLRFAADLHDVQGHHLQAIALKAELARRLVGGDDDGARRHAAEVQELALAALAETRSLVHGYRQVGLSTELENAVAILRAADVEATISGTPEQVPEPLQPLFGALVREAATNLLRHSRAERCAISVEVEGAEVVLRVQDDGIAREPGPDVGDDPGTGIVGLGERFAAVGGRVEGGPLPDRGFALTGRAPR